MNVLIPMAGAGLRFAEYGYKQHKPVIPTTDRRTGEKVPMVVAAVRDLPFDPLDPKNDLIFIVRDFHQADGVTTEIARHYPKAKFVVIDRLTEGQASTCLLAKAFIDNDASLLIAACDNGMDIDRAFFDSIAQDIDALIFTFRDNPAVTEKPQAYGWVKTDDTRALGVSIKVPLSSAPMNDHAIVGTFWFRRGRDFVKAAQCMIEANERVNGEFYVDQVFRNMIERGQNVAVFEVEKYLCWGAPKDYEAYEQTIAYWRDFVNNEARK